MDWKTIRFGVIAIPVMLGGTMATQANEFADCVGIVAMSEFATKKAFQIELNDLIENERSDLKAIANLNMKLQIALARSRRMQMNFLLQSDPDRLDTSRGIVRFTNCSWDESDHTALVSKSILYQSVRAEIKELKARSAGHPQWPALRQFFTHTLSGG